MIEKLTYIDKLIFIFGFPFMLWLIKYVSQFIFEQCIDRKRAFSKLKTELETRIATQSLPDDQGTEEGALKSMYEVFKNIRTLKLEHPLNNSFQEKAGLILEIIRPFTAKWHKLKEEKKLEDSDCKATFREELRSLQKDIRFFINKHL